MKKAIVIINKKENFNVNNVRNLILEKNNIVKYTKPLKVAENVYYLNK